MQITFRSPMQNDAYQVLDLMTACCLAEYGMLDNELSDLLHDWRQVDLRQDVWLAFNSRQGLVGYAAVMPWSGNLRYDIYLHPHCEEKQLSIQFLEICERRARQIAQSKEHKQEIQIIFYTPHVNQRLTWLVEGAGFKVVKYIFNMRITMQQAPPPAAWPQGMSIRPFTLGQYEKNVHAFIQAAFERPGCTPQPFSEWQTAMLRPEIFDPQLWTLVYAGDELVGACLAYPYEVEGWVRQLGVDANWRRKGLGTALLQHTFGLFFQRGYSNVGLSVDEDNQNAYQFYERVGMRRIRQYDEYRRPLFPK